MNEEEFGRFLKKGGRAPNVVKRCIAYVKEFEKHCAGKDLAQATPKDLEDFVAWIEEKPKTSAKSYLWAMRYYYEYTSNEEMRDLASQLRRQRIKHKPFALGKFRGANPDHVKKLAAVGVKNVAQMLKAGQTQSGRQELAEQTGVPLDAILEFVKLSDLARIAGLKSIRARLYHDAGADTIEKLAQWDPEELGAMLAAFVEQTGFDGIAPLPKEARHAVADAQKLPKIVEY